MTQVLAPPLDSGAPSGITDEELTAQALSGDPDAPLSDDAVSFWEVTEVRPGLLPSWYMPTAAAGARQLRGWQRSVAWTLVGAFVAIDAVGLCSTYGPILLR